MLLSRFLLREKLYHRGICIPPTSEQYVPLIRIAYTVCTETLRPVERNLQVLTKSQKDISNALDSINGAFESLLERFFVEQEIDIASDISAMETIMTQEGLVNNGIE